MRKDGQYPRIVASGPGGTAGPDLCREHGIPIIHPSVGESLCALCTQDVLTHILRKIGHGCSDFTCPLCDEELPRSDTP